MTDLAEPASSHPPADAATGPNALPPTSLDDVDRITDLYCLEPVTGGPVEQARTGGKGAYCYYGSPGRADLGGTEIEGWVDGLLKEIARLYPTEEDFRIEHNGRAFRGCRDRSGLTSEIGLRRLPVDVPRLADLQFDQPITAQLLEGTWLNQGGLVILAGLYGSGKTTVASATIRARLERFGGRAVTVENPPEFPLEGKFGAGACRQLEVSYTEPDPWRRGFAGALRRAYRKLPATRPGILFVGEVRDTETAAELVKAALNGMLVITTTHAPDPISAVVRLTALAQEELGEMAPLLVGQALRLSVHNQLQLSSNVDGWRRGHYNATTLVSDGDNHPTATAIRLKRFSELNQIINFQQASCRQALQKGLTGSQFLDMVGSKSQGMRAMAADQAAVTQRGR